MDKIRILFCMETIGWGGVEQRRLSIVRGLISEGFVFKIICTKLVGGMGVPFYHEGVEIIEVGEFNHPFEIQKHQEVVKIIRRFRPHIIHGAVFEGNSMAAVSGRLCKVPVVILEETSDPKNRSKKATWLLNLFSRLADKFIAISPSVEEYLLRNARINPAKTKLINNGVQIPRRVSTEEIDALRIKLNLTEDYFVIGSVGRLRNFHKCFTDIIKAAALIDKRLTIKILIVGEGQDKQLIKDAAKELGLQENLIMVGLQVDTAPYYEIMDVFCIASHMEGFGLVAAEAMYHQLPVIATAVGGLKDIVIDGKTGFLVPSHSPDKIAEKLQTLMDDPELRRSMGTKGLARAEKEYSAEVYVGKVHQLYKELLEEKGILDGGFWSEKWLEEKP